MKQLFRLLALASTQAKNLARLRLKISALGIQVYQSYDANHLPMAFEGSTVKGRGV